MNKNRLLHWGWSQKMFSTNLETHQKPNKQKAIKLSRVSLIITIKKIIFFSTNKKSDTFLNINLDKKKCKKILSLLDFQLVQLESYLESST